MEQQWHDSSFDAAGGSGGGQQGGYTQPQQRAPSSQGGQQQMFTPSAPPPPQQQQQQHAPAGGMFGFMGGGSVPVESEDYSSEPPLLNEIGIDLEHIRKKTQTVLDPRYFLLEKLHLGQEYYEDADLAGPLVINILLGTILMLSGAMRFSAIYGLALFCCIGMYVLMNMMSNGVKLSKVVSVLGYSLLPIVGLATVDLILPLQNLFGFLVGAFAVVWSALAASYIFETSLKMNEKRWLVAYPLLLCYAAFALITVF